MRLPPAEAGPPVIPGAHPAATLVLLRDTVDGPQVLMVRRHAQLRFHGGAWAFPGGRIEVDDGWSVEESDGKQILGAARRAAAREAHEEAGVEVIPDDLVLFSRWVTPEGLPKRFDAWFFAASDRGGEVVVDGSEIDDHCWMRPGEALAAQARGDIELPPPTFVTLASLRHHVGVETMLAELRRTPAPLFVPRMCVVPGGACTLYEGDAGYASADADVPGPRHRLWMIDSGWWYEETPE